MQLPTFREGNVIIQNGQYYLEYNFNKHKETTYLAKVTPDSTFFIEGIAKMEIHEIQRRLQIQKERKAFRKWGKELSEKGII